MGLQESAHQRGEDLWFFQIHQVSSTGYHNACSSGYCHDQGTSHSLVVCNVTRASENQRRHPQVSHIREDWLLRQGHIVVLMVLRSGIEQPPKVFARSVIARKDEIVWITLVSPPEAQTVTRLNLGTRGMFLPSAVNG